MSEPNEDANQGRESKVAGVNDQTRASDPTSKTEMIIFNNDHYLLVRH